MSDSQQTTRRVVGCMTGTSIDAMDVAVVQVHGHGLRLRAVVERCTTTPLGKLGLRLRKLADQVPCTSGEVAALARDFSALHIDTIQAALGENSADLVAIHGQTVFHAAPLSWQLFAPTPVARALAAPVVCDLRAADLAAGGEGAPITPLADFVLLRSDVERRVILNLGGFANFTALPAADDERAIDRIRGGDICACNHVLDAVARALLGAPFDDGGHRAAGGTAQPALVDALVALQRTSSAGGRSLGTGDELTRWFDDAAPHAAPEDVARSACCALAQIIAAHIPETDRVLVAGGAVHNATLMAELRNACRAPVALTTDFGVAAEYREAMAMAVLGALCQDRIPITLPAVTRVPPTAPVAGVWAYP